MVKWGWGSAMMGEKPQPSVTTIIRVEEEIPVDVKTLFAEFLGVTFVVLFAAGSAAANGWEENALLISFGVGMAILVLSYSIYHHSGAQLNPAITFNLWIGEKITLTQALFNFFAQLSGSVCGALIIWGIFPCREDLTTTLGSNIIKHAYGSGHAFFVEFIVSTLICFVYWETVISPVTEKFRGNAFVAVGFTYFAVSLALIPIDGSGANPARSFGPAVISKARDCHNYTAGAIEDLWITLIAPFIGAIMAYLIQKVFEAECGFFDEDEEEEETVTGEGIEQELSYRSEPSRTSGGNLVEESYPTGGSETRV